MNESDNAALKETPSLTRFESLGLYLPEKTVTTQSLLDRLKEKPIFDLIAFSGIESRQMRSKDEDTLVMSLAAAQDCLSRSKYNAEDLDVVISGAITRVNGDAEYFLEPAMSLWVRNGLGATNALHFDVSNACAGMFTGVHLLDGLIKAGVVKNGLVVSGECNSSIYETAVREIESSFDEQFASLTVGDAATAVILDGEATDTDRMEFIEMVSCTESAYLCLGKPSDKSAGVALYTKNTKLHGEDNLKLWPFTMQRVLDERGTTFEEEGFTHLIPHQLGVRFTEKFQQVSSETLGVKMPDPIHVLQHTGNTSSTTHFVALYLALKDGRIKPGDKLIFQPAASGIVTGCISVTVSGMGL